MNIFEFAKKMEKDGEAFYLRMAENAPSKGFKSILERLANAERKHFDTLVEMEKGITEGLPLKNDFPDSTRNEFDNMEHDFLNTEPPISQIEMYEKASCIEKTSRDFYEQKAFEVDGYKREIFLRIAEEEKTHLLQIEEMIEFMQQPVRWLENAEWHHSAEY